MNHKAELFRNALDNMGEHALPVFANCKITTEHFVPQVTRCLELQGFHFHYSPGEVWISHGKDPMKLMSAPTVEDLTLLLAISGAWAMVK